MSAAANFDPVESALQDIADGKLIIVTDDENRENEGDLVMAASKATPETINMMIRHARGLICVPTTAGQLRHLGINPMVQENREAQRTAFTVSVDAADGITTGISAYDRARTIRLLADPDAQSSDLVQPGHIFPLKARAGGVLERAGHTEAAVDLARMAGLYPSGVICEIQNPDGSMARLPQLADYAQRHGLRLISIADLIRHRLDTERFVKRLAEARMPSSFGTFRAIGFRNELDGSEHIAIVKGHPERAPGAVLVRVHSECLTGDAFGSLRCDCRPQL